MPTKSPFVSYTPEQIFAAEPTTFVIVVGSEFYDSDGSYFFTKNSAARHYNKIHRQLAIRLHEGTDEEKAHARRVLNNLIIQPTRIH